MRIISLRHNPEYLQATIDYFVAQWGSDVPYNYFVDAISHCFDTPMDLPQWYLLLDGEKVIGCAGLTHNDLFSRMDLYPWLCCLYIDPAYRGHRYGGLLLDKALADTKAAGYGKLYLYTDHIGYYEKFGYTYIGDGYQYSGQKSRIYEKAV